MNGLLYYNSGTGCLLRLAVSLHSLRKHYAGPVCILHEQDDGDDWCHRIATTLGADTLPASFTPPVPPGAHYPFVAKTRCGELAPYDVTVMIDADTLVRAPIDDLFGFITGPVEFAVPQFAAWNTSGKIAKRIEGWRPHMPAKWIEAALAFGKAINNGVTVFRKGSSFMARWSEWALRGREQYIPDESSLQVLVAVNRDCTAILPHWWNTSCKYDDPLSPEARIVHFHGRKHVRIDAGKPIYHSDLWYTEWEEFHVKHSELADALFRTDRHARNYAGEYERWRKSQA